MVRQGDDQGACVLIKGSIIDRRGHYRRHIRQKRQWNQRNGCEKVRETNRKHPPTSSLFLDTLNPTAADGEGGAVD
jgi:hypothetical protein